MSYEVHNQHHSLGQFASNSGLADFVRSVSSDHPTLKQFLNTGMAEDVPSVVDDLQKLLQDSTTAGDIRSTAAALMNKIKGQAVVIITDGLSD